MGLFFATHICTCQNPYPHIRVRVLMGTGQEFGRFVSISCFIGWTHESTHFYWVSFYNKMYSKLHLYYKCLYTMQMGEFWWEWVTVIENEWKWVKIDDHWWMRVNILVGGNGWVLMKMSKNGGWWKWITFYENGWLLLENRWALVTFSKNGNRC